MSLFHINRLFVEFIASRKNLPDAFKMDYIGNPATWWMMEQKKEKKEEGKLS